MHDSPFYFGDTADMQLAPHSITFDIPKEIATKEALMDIYAKIIIEEDSYFFGRTWDALSDMLEDFGWVPDELHEIVLSHEDIPLASDKIARKVYLDLLADVAKYWSYGEGSDRRVFIRFPKEMEAEVRKILDSSERYEHELAAKQHEEKHDHGHCCGH